MNNEADAVISFWRDAGPDKWFAKDDRFDVQFKAKYLDLHFAVARREREHWQQQPYSALAAVLMLDQFPRNAFRGTGHMFATDTLARHYARRIINAGFLADIEPALRLFACVPFIHSEELQDQEYALTLYREHAPDAMHWAVDHHGIIQRFGRFPHRNPVLGRETTQEEQAFLANGGFAG